MKIIRFSFIITITVFVLISSCTKDFEDINTNPNYATTTSPEYLFNYIIKEGGGEYFNWTMTHNYLNQWMMHSAKFYGNSTWPPYDYLTPKNIEDLWLHYYTRILLNTNELLNLTVEDEADINKKFGSPYLESIYFPSGNRLMGRCSVF